MQRKRVLGVSTLALFLFASGAIGYFFFSSLKPSARAHANLASLSQYNTSELKVGATRIVPIRGLPYFVQRLENDQFFVLNLQPQFLNDTVGCAVNQVADRENNWCEAAFIEPCRGVCYDSQGLVLENSHPDALPLEKPIWHFDGVYIHFPVDA